MGTGHHSVSVAATTTKGEWPHVDQGLPPVASTLKEWLTANDQYTSGIGL